MADNHQVYASEDVLEKLGFITAYIPETAKTDTIIVSSEDLLRRGQALPKTELLAPLFEGEPEQLVLVRSGLKALFNEFAQDGLKNTEQIYEIAGLKIATTALDGSANGIPIDFDNDGVNDVGIIVTPHLDRSAAEADAFYTRFPVELMVNPTGTEFENLAMTMWHEAGHLSQPAVALHNENTGYGKMPLTYEIDADQKAIQTYLQAFEDGHALDKEFIQDFIDRRLVGSFAAHGADIDFAFAYGEMETHPNQHIDTTSHSTHFALNRDGSINASIQDLSNLMTENTPESEQLSGMMFANTAINMVLGQDYLQNTKDTPPMKIADFGAQIAANNPVKGLAAGQALLNKMPALQEHPMGEYIEKIHEFFEQRGNNIRQHPEYLASLEHFTLLLEGEISVADELNNDLGVEDLSAAAQSLDQLVENHFSNLMLAAQDAGNEEALEKLQTAYAEYSGTGITGKNRAESNSDIYKADQAVDAAREAMRASINITADHHDLMQHYPSDEISQSPLSRLSAYNDGFDEISRIAQSIESDAVQLNNENSSPVAQIELGPNLS